jgi:hypothetical protein
VETAFVIGVGVASGAIIVATYQAYRERTLQPVADAMSEGLAMHVARSGKRRATRWWREHAQPAPGAMPNMAKNPAIRLPSVTTCVALVTAKGPPRNM